MHLHTGGVRSREGEGKKRQHKTELPLAPTSAEMTSVSEPIRNFKVGREQHVPDSSDQPRYLLKVVQLHLSRGNLS